jgi:hypothetical protein
MAPIKTKNSVPLITLYQTAPCFYNYIYHYEAKIIAYKQWIMFHIGDGKI